MQFQEQIWSKNMKTEINHHACKQLSQFACLLQNKPPKSAATEASNYPTFSWLTKCHLKQICFHFLFVLNLKMVASRIRWCWWDDHRRTTSTQRKREKILDISCWGAVQREQGAKKLLTSLLNSGHKAHERQLGGDLHGWGRGRVWAC